MLPRPVQYHACFRFPQAVPRLQPRRGKLRFNDYGFAVGGPVTVPKVFSGKDKFFFFFGMEWKKIRQDSSPSLATIPTVAERGGDFSPPLYVQNACNSV